MRRLTRRAHHRWGQIASSPSRLFIRSSARHAAHHDAAIGFSMGPKNSAPKPRCLLSPKTVAGRAWVLACLGSRMLVLGCFGCRWVSCRYRVARRSADGTRKRQGHCRIHDHKILDLVGISTTWCFLVPTTTRPPPGMPRTQRRYGGKDPRQRTGTERVPLPLVPSRARARPPLPS